MSNNPFGSGGSSGIDFDLDDLRSRLPSGRWISLLPAFIAVFVLAISSVYTIGPEEEGVVLRLGEYRGREHVSGPGLHFKLPFVDRVIPVPVERQLKEEFGFRTEDVAVQSRFSGPVEREANMLTGDQNAVLVEWVVQYRVVDPYKYLFRVRNIDSTFRDMSEAVMRKVVGDRTVNEVVTVGRVEIETEVERLLQDLCDQYETGIRVEQVVLQSNNPPDPVKPSFNEVNQAEQDRDRLINEAQAQYNRVIPRAEGQARQLVEQAEGYAVDRVNRAQGDASRFNAIYAEYRGAPEVTRKRMYLEALGRILPSVGRTLIIDDELEGMIPLLDLKTLGAAAAATSEEGGS